MRKKYQSKERKSNHKFEVVGEQELLVRVPLPMAELWAEMQTKAEGLTGQAGLQILQAILEEEVSRSFIGTTAGTHARGPGSGIRKLPSVAAGSKIFLVQFPVNSQTYKPTKEQVPTPSTS